MVDGRQAVVATAKHRPRLDHMKRQYAVSQPPSTTPRRWRAAEVILLCVKPQVAQSVIDEGPRYVCTPDQILVSIIAGL